MIDECTMVDEVQFDWVDRLRDKTRGQTRLVLMEEILEGRKEEEMLGRKKAVGNRYSRRAKVVKELWGFWGGNEFKRGG